MKAPLTVLKKRCERCDQLYDLPPVTSRGRAKELLIQFFPCGQCGFFKEWPYKNGSEKTGRCRGCSIPFTIINHHRRGRCHRCDMRHFRKKASQK